MEVFNGFTIVHLSWRDRTTVRQVFDRNENPIDKERMLRGKVQIATGILIIKSKASDPIGATLLCQDEAAFLNVRRPIHLIGRGPLRVLTRAPIVSSSTGTSPVGVRMRVPMRKQ